MLRARREQPKRKGTVSDFMALFGGKGGIRRVPTGHSPARQPAGTNAGTDAQKAS